MEHPFRHAECARPSPQSRGRVRRAATRDRHDAWPNIGAPEGMVMAAFARSTVLVAFIALVAIGLVKAQSPTSGPPPWAYGVAAVSPSAIGPAARAGNAGSAPADDGSAKQLEGSPRSFTLAQLRDGFNIADWYPDDHPPMPAVV